MIRIFFLCVNHNIILDLYPMIIFLKELNLKQWEKSHGIILLTTCHNFAVSSTSQNEYHLTNFPQWGQPCGLIMVSNLTWLDISLITKAKIQIYFEIAFKINWLLILQPVTIIPTKWLVYRLEIAIPNDQITKVSNFWIKNTYDGVTCIYIFFLNFFRITVINQLNALRKMKVFCGMQYAQFCNSHQTFRAWK